MAQVRGFTGAMRDNGTYHAWIDTSCLYIHPVRKSLIVEGRPPLAGRMRMQAVTINPAQNRFNLQGSLKVFGPLF